LPGVALHGGGGSKVPAYFEEDWTLLTMLDLVQGHADRIQLEVPGSSGWGFEFWIGRSSIREWHQVKYQNSSTSRWTMAELASNDVLENFRNKLDTETDATCWFVSADGIAPLDRLCDRAGHFPDLPRFQAALTEAQMRDGFRDLCEKHWNRSPLEVWEWLRERVFVEHLSWGALGRALRDRATATLGGDPTDAIDAVRRVKRVIEYVEITAEDFEQRLNDEGVFPRTWLGGDGSPESSVAAASQRFRRGLDVRRINGALLPRPQISEIQRLLREPRPPPTILVTGLRGHGKSAVLSDIVAWALGEPWQVLALDAGSLNLERTTADVGESLKLPDTPAVTLAAAAKGGRGLFVIDALDVLALDRDKPVELFQVVDDVIQEAHRQSSITVVIGCRSEDLESDVRLRALKNRSPIARQVDVPPLDENQVSGALVTAGIDPEALSRDQLELVRVPICLAYLTLTPELPYDFATEQDLQERWLGLHTNGESA
jgi:hypothetical protein